MIIVPYFSRSLTLERMLRTEERFIFITHHNRKTLNLG